MSAVIDTRKPGTPVVLWTAPGMLAISLFLQHEFQARRALLFLAGAGPAMNGTTSNTGCPDSSRRKADRLR